MMKKIILLTLISINVFYGQNEKQKTFKLYKGGESYPSPIVYIKVDEENFSVKKSESGDLIFNLKNKIFKFSKKNIYVNPLVE